MPIIKSVKLNTRVISKSADETRNNTNTYTDDNTLKIPVNANQNKMFLMFLFINAHADGDFKFQWTIPAGGALTRCAGTVFQSTNGQAVADGTTGISVTTNTGTTYFWHTAYRYIGGAAGGYLTLQWAQNTKAAVDCTLQEGSCLVVFE